MDYRNFIDSINVMHKEQRVAILKEDLGLHCLTEQALRKRLYKARLAQHNLKEGTVARADNDKIIEQITVMLEGDVEVPKQLENLDVAEPMGNKASRKKMIDMISKALVGTSPNKE